MICSAQCEVNNNKPMTYQRGASICTSMMSRGAVAVARKFPSNKYKQGSVMCEAGKACSASVRGK